MWEYLKIDKVLKIDGIYTIFEGEYDRNYAFPGEVHDFWEMVYIIDGSVCVCADENVYHMGENEIIFHRPMQLHKFNIENNKKARMFIVSFDMTGEFAPQLENKVCRLSPNQTSLLFSLFNFLNHSESILGVWDLHSMKNFIPAFSKPSVAQTVQNMLENFLLSLCGGSSDICAADDTVEAAVYSAAVRYMNANINSRLSTSDIARECKVSLTQLKNIFSKYAGMGIHKYFLSLKLQTAMRLLSGGSSVSQTAAALNFSSQNYFSVVFKRETGMSPTEYIRRKTP